MHKPAQTDAKKFSLLQGGFDGPVAVLMGGVAAEREVSLQSGAAVMAALESLGVEVQAIDTREGAIEKLQQVKPSFAFIALHGIGGEDGKIQAVLEQLGIPYSGSGVLGSALAMDKVRSKNLWNGLALPTPEMAMLSADSDFVSIINALGGKVIVKPASEGSSFGMAIAATADELAVAYANAAEYDSRVFAERFISGPEYTVALLDGYRLPSIRIETERSFYNFAAKYTDDNTSFHIPSGLPVETEEALQHIALSAFESLGCRTWGRVDFMCDAGTGDFFLLEANTVPGLTDHSLVPMAAAAIGMDFPALVTSIIEVSMHHAG